MHIPDSSGGREPVLTLTGCLLLHAENYRGIDLLTPGKIILRTRGTGITVTGRDLTAEYYTREELLIRGKIERIEFGSGREIREGGACL